MKTMEDKDLLWALRIIQMEQTALQKLAIEVLKEKMKIQDNKDKTIAYYLKEQEVQDEKKN